MDTELPLEWVSFKDSAWIQTFGLNASNVLDYFSLSQFYDRTCNNEVVKMQTQFNNLQEMNFKLSQMTGTEYILSHFQEPVLYVIRKQLRTSPQSAKHMESFYVIEGSIYKSPCLADVINARLSMATFYLDKSLDEMIDSSNFSLSHGFRWLLAEKESSKQQVAEEEPVDDDFDKPADDYTIRSSNRINYEFQSFMVNQHRSQVAAASRRQKS